MIASDGGNGDQFGRSVSLSGERALIGARWDDDDNNGSNAGSAYVFEFESAAWSETARLTASDGAANDFFGASVSLSGTRALIGASGDGDIGFNSGSAYVFDFDGVGWSETGKLIASDGGIGRSVSLFGNRALLGAGSAAYVFDFNGSTWLETTKIMTSDGSVDDLFGSSVGLSGEQALVGARLDDENAPDSGSAYLFEFIGTVWTESTKLTAGDGPVDDQFGWSVSISGDRALVGAYRDDDNGGASGSAYIFSFDGASWMMAIKLTPDDGEFAAVFGASVSLSGDRALIGAPGDRQNAPSSGAAYVFDFDGTTWRATAKLTASDGSFNDTFGASVSPLGDRALIAAPNDNSNSGSVYVFTFNGASWDEITKLTASDGAPDDLFGNSLSLGSNRLLVGAPSFASNGSNPGSAYIFDFNGNAWSEAAKITPTDGAPNELFGYSVSLQGCR